MLTLCTLAPLRHTWLFFPSSSCSMLPPSLLGVDCLSPSLSGGPGPPSTPPPPLLSWPHFRQVPGKPYPRVEHSSFLTHFHAYFDLKYCSSKNLAKNICCNKYFFFSRDVSRLFSDSKFPLKKSVFSCNFVEVRHLLKRCGSYLAYALWNRDNCMYTWRFTHWNVLMYIYKEWVYLYMWTFIKSHISPPRPVGTYHFQVGLIW